MSDPRTPANPPMLTRKQTLDSISAVAEALMAAHKLSTQTPASATAATPPKPTFVTIQATLLRLESAIKQQRLDLLNAASAKHKHGEFQAIIDELSQFIEEIKLIKENATADGIAKLGMFETVKTKLETLKSSYETTDKKIEALTTAPSQPAAAPAPQSPQPSKSPQSLEAVEKQLTEMRANIEKYQKPIQEILRKDKGNQVLLKLNAELGTYAQNISDLEKQVKKVRDDGLQQGMQTLNPLLSPINVLNDKLKNTFQRVDDAVAQIQNKEMTKFIGKSKEIQGSISRALDSAKSVRTQFVDYSDKAAALDSKETSRNADAQVEILDGYKSKLKQMQRALVTTLKSPPNEEQIRVQNETESHAAEISRLIRKLELDGRNKFISTLDRVKKAAEEKTKKNEAKQQPASPKAAATGASTGTKSTTTTTTTSTTAKTTGPTEKPIETLGEQRIRIRILTQQLNDYDLEGKSKTINELIGTIKNVVLITPAEKMQLVGITREADEIIKRIGDNHKKVLAFQTSLTAPANEPLISELNARAKALDTIQSSLKADNSSLIDLRKHLLDLRNDLVKRNEVQNLRAQQKAASTSSTASQGKAEIPAPIAGLGDVEAKTPGVSAATQQLPGMLDALDKTAKGYRFAERLAETRAVFRSILKIIEDKKLGDNQIEEIWKDFDTHYDELERIDKSISENTTKLSQIKKSPTTATIEQVNGIKKELEQENQSLTQLHGRLLSVEQNFKNIKVATPLSPQSSGTKESKSAASTTATSTTSTQTVVTPSADVDAATVERIKRLVAKTSAGLASAKDKLATQLQRVQLMEKAFTDLNSQAKDAVSKNKSSAEIAKLSKEITSQSERVSAIKKNLEVIEKDITRELTIITANVTEGTLHAAIKTLEKANNEMEKAAQEIQNYKPKTEAEKLAALSERTKAELAKQADELRSRFDTLNNQFQSANKYIAELKGKTPTDEQKKAITALEEELNSTSIITGKKHLEDRTRYFKSVLGPNTDAGLDSVSTKKEFDILSKKIDTYSNDVTKKIYKSLATIDAEISKAQKTAPATPAAAAPQKVEDFIKPIEPASVKIGEAKTIKAPDEYAQLQIDIEAKQIQLNGKLQALAAYSQMVSDKANTASTTDSQKIKKAINDSGIENDIKKAKDAISNESRNLTKLSEDIEADIIKPTIEDAQTRFDAITQSINKIDIKAIGVKFNAIDAEKSESDKLREEYTIKLGEFKKIYGDIKKAADEYKQVKPIPQGVEDPFLTGADKLMRVDLELGVRSSALQGKNPTAHQIKTEITLVERSIEKATEFKTKIDTEIKTINDAHKKQFDPKTDKYRNFNHTNSRLDSYAKLLDFYAKKTSVSEYSRSDLEDIKNIEEACVKLKIQMKDYISALEMESKLRKEPSKPEHILPNVQDKMIEPKLTKAKLYLIKIEEIEENIQSSSMGELASNKIAAKIATHSDKTANVTTKDEAEKQLNEFLKLDPKKSAADGPRIALELDTDSKTPPKIAFVFDGDERKVNQVIMETSGIISDTKTAMAVVQSKKGDHYKSTFIFNPKDDPNKFTRDSCTRMAIAEVENFRATSTKTVYIKGKMSTKLVEEIATYCAHMGYKYENHVNKFTPGKKEIDTLHKKITNNPDYFLEHFTREQRAKPLMGKTSLDKMEERTGIRKGP